MKRRFLVIIYSLALLCLSSCDKDPFDSKSEFSKMLDTVESQLKSGIQVDEIFLNYKFGMSKKEVSKHTSFLLSKDKLQKDSKGIPFYNFALLQKEFKTYLKFEYQEEQLYKLYLILENGFWGPKNVASSLSLKYMEKYLRSNQQTAQIFSLLPVANDHSARTYFFMVEDEKSDLTDYYFIKGNLQIHIYNNFHDQTIVQYTDMKVEKEIDYEQRRKENSQVNDL